MGVEHPSTGWEPDADPRDTLVRAGVLSLADRIERQVRALVQPVVRSSDDGRRVYEDLGYLPVVRWTLWMRPG